MRALQEIFNRLVELAGEGYASDSFVVDAATMRDCCAFVRKGELVGKALLGTDGIKINFLAKEKTWGGSVWVPISPKGVYQHEVGFDADRVYSCFATARNREIMEIEEKGRRWIMSDGSGRTWTHTLADTDAGVVIPEDKIRGIGEIKLFFTADYLKSFIRDIRAAVKEEKSYDDIIFATDGTQVVVYLDGNDVKHAELARIETEENRGASVSLYPLPEFLKILKAVKTRGKTEGLKFYLGPEKLMRAIFPIRKGKAEVLIAPKLERDDETFGKFFPELHRRQEEQKAEQDADKAKREHAKAEREKMEEEQDRRNCLLARGLIVNKDAHEVGRIVRLERSESGKLFYLIIEKGKWATDTKKTAYKQLENAKRRFRWLTQKEVEEK